MTSHLHRHYALLASARSSGRVIEEPFGLIVDTGLDSETFNVIVTSRRDAVVSGVDVQRCLKEFGSRRFVWWTGPKVSGHFRTVLADAGLVALEPEPAMAVAGPVMRTTEAPLTISRVTGAASLDSYVSILARNWTPPAEVVAAFYARLAPVVADPSFPVMLFLGRSGGVPVSGAEVALGSDGVAGLYNVATLKTEQGTGGWDLAGCARGPCPPP